LSFSFLVGVLNELAGLLEVVEPVNTTAVQLEEIEKTHNNLKIKIDKRNKNLTT
jgi:hypothetical protein